MHHMRKKKIDQWDEKYPDKEILLQDINSQELFVGEIAGEIAVLFVLTAPLNLFAHFAVTPTDTNVSASCIVRAFGYLMLRKCGFLILFHALDTNG